MFAAGLGAVQDLVPIFGPRFAPRHVAPAGFAGFAGQALLVAFEACLGVIRWTHRFRSLRSMPSCCAIFSKAFSNSDRAEPEMERK